MNQGFRDVWFESCMVWFESCMVWIKSWNLVKNGNWLCFYWFNSWECDSNHNSTWLEPWVLLIRIIASSLTFWTLIQVVVSSICIHLGEMKKKWMSVWYLQWVWYHNLLLPNYVFSFIVEHKKINRREMINLFKELINLITFTKNSETHFWQDP